MQFIMEQEKRKMNRRGRPLEIEWQESTKELRSYYQTEDNIARRARLHAFWFLREGKSLKEVSELLSTSYRTLQRWVAWYRRGGLKEVLQRTPGGGPGKPAFLSTEQFEKLRQEVDTGRFYTAKEVANWIEQQWKVKYTTDGIYSIFRRMGITRKVPRKQSE